MASPADITNLATEYSQLIALRVSLTASPKPTYSVDGVSYSWESYYEMLSKKLEQNLKDQQQATGPFDVAG